MAREQTRGACSLCGKSFARSGMARHLPACLEAHAGTSGRRDAGRQLLLQVQGAYAGDYWMLVEMPATATFAHLDSFLRDTWLECCGHLSAFTVGQQRYASSPDISWMPEKGMGIQLGRVLVPGMTFRHEYDYGSTTELALRVASERRGEAGKESVRLLARNDPPAIACVRCGKPATQACVECLYDGEGWFCDDCLVEHDCGDEMALPVVNSPRCGVCGYTGTALT